MAERASTRREKPAKGTSGATFLRFQTAPLTQILNDAAATEQETHELAVAALNYDIATAWYFAAPSAWRLYHVQLAAAESERVRQINSAEIVKTRTAGEISVTRIQTDLDTERVFVGTIYGNNGAFVRRAATIAQSNIDLAEANSLSSFVQSQAAAVRTHDLAVADATLAYRQVVVSQDAIRDRLLNEALTDRAESYARTKYVFAVDPNSDAEEEWAMNRATNATYVSVAARANADRLIAIERRRHTWKHEVGDGRVQMVESIVASQFARGDQIRDDLITSATAVAEAVRNFGVQKATAEATRSIDLMSAEATEIVASAGNSALYSRSAVAAAGSLSVARTTARHVYEVALHTQHRDSSAAFDGATASLESAFFVAVADADRLFALRNAMSDTIYVRLLAALRLARQVDRNAAETTLSLQSSNANVGQNSYLTQTNLTYASGAAYATATLYVRQETARAGLLVGKSAALGAADIAYAKAGRDKENAYADADLAFVEVVVPAQAVYQETCGINYWSLSAGCSGDFEVYDDAYQAALDVQREAKEMADEEYRRELDGIELGEDGDLSEFRIDFVAEMGKAQVAFAWAQARSLKARADANADNGLVFETTNQTATMEYNLAVQSSDFVFTVAAGAQEVAHQGRLLDVAAGYAWQRGLLEADLRIAQSTILAAAWQDLSQSHLTNTFLRFKSAESAARTTWLTNMRTEFAQFQVATRTADRQFILNTVSTRVEHETRLASISGKSAFLNNLHEQRRQLSFVIAEGDNGVVSATNQGALLVGVAHADRQHADRLVEADTNYVVELDQIQQQFERDQDWEARWEALDEADYRNERAAINADAYWRFTLAQGEFEFGTAEAARQSQLTQELTRIAHADNIHRAISVAIDEMSVARANVERQFDDVVHKNVRRESMARANADLLSAGHTNRSVALAQFSSLMSSPWAEFEWQKAVAEQAAWDSMLNEFLVVEANISAAEVDFANERLAAYLTTSTEIALANKLSGIALADAASSQLNRAAREQRSFETSLSALTTAYRTQLANFERVRDIALADPDGDPFEANQDYQTATSQLESDYQMGVTDTRRVRREVLAQAGFDLTSLSAAINSQRSQLNAQSQIAFDVALVDAFYEDGGTGGLAVVQADLEFDFVAIEAAALTNELESIPSGPWSNLAMAEAVARENDVIRPLAELNRQQQKTLAAARNAHHGTMSLATILQSQLTAQKNAAADTIIAAGRLAQVSAFQEGEIEFPESLTPPTPDLGTIRRQTENYSTNYPNIIDIESNVHGNWPSGYWGNNWGPNYTFNPAWQWSRYGQYDYGWGFSNYFGYYGYDSGYSGNRTYRPWYFRQDEGGWSGTYNSPPEGFSNNFYPDINGSLNDFGQSIEDQLDPFFSTFESIAGAGDAQPPILDATSNTIWLGDANVAFKASEFLESGASTILDDFVIGDSRGSFDSRRDDFAPVSRLPIAKPAESIAIPNPFKEIKLAYDFSERFLVFRSGGTVFVRQGTATTIYSPHTGSAAESITYSDEATYVGYYDTRTGWVSISGAFGGGRATLSSLRKATKTWNGPDMRDIIRAAYTEEELEEQRPQLQQLIDGIRSPMEIRENANSVGIFIGGTNMHFYGVGNVEKMYNMYQGSKFYYGGVGNIVDSNFGFGAGGGLGETIQGATAITDFSRIIGQAMADILDYFAEHGDVNLHIYGWSRGAAQAIELARVLGTHGIEVDFIGAFDPVYSVGSAGQGSRFIHEPTKASKNANYVEATVSENVREITAIYAMNEVRSWFPATILHQDGASTNLTMIGSPGAHGEVGGHFASNAMVQQLNLHQMIAYTPSGSSLFRNDPFDTDVEAIYDSVYTTYVANRDARAEDLAFSLQQYSEALLPIRWSNFTQEEYVKKADTRLERLWRPGRLAAQTPGSGGGLKGHASPNGLFLIETSYEMTRRLGTLFVSTQTAGIVNLYDDDSTIGRIEQPFLDYYKRDIAGIMEKGIWDLYAGIHAEFIESLYTKSIDVFEGGYRY